VRVTLVRFSQKISLRSIREQKQRNFRRWRKPATQEHLIAPKKRVTKNLTLKLPNIKPVAKNASLRNLIFLLV